MSPDASARRSQSCRSSALEGRPAGRWGRRSAGPAPSSPRCVCVSRVFQGAGPPRDVTPGECAECAAAAGLSRRDFGFKEGEGRGLEAAGPPCSWSFSF
ncbi:hypothetical protein NDU88_010252 [Pleurodeles waltl]|uniref:Uncharacterized protein n=1 Tax=Pleurodeles waltl TaxID=8319 RepID=A0AAV7S029_PLEWA|nr:hypothetical protein NDU88_010252 [Pleurodeles waltl]